MTDEELRRALVGRTITTIFASGREANRYEEPTLISLKLDNGLVFRVEAWGAWADELGLSCEVSP
jgi:hypothetical protein